MGEPLSVLVVDDNPVIRAGLRMLLADCGDLDVVGEAEDGRTGLALAARLSPDVVLLDVRMPGGGGLEVLGELVKQSCVLMLTSTEDDAVVREAMTCGARGYLVYGTFDEAALLQGIRTAVNGSSVLSPGAAQALLGLGPAERSTPGRLTSPGALPPEFLAHLSDREVDVLDLMAAGRSNTEIAQALFLAPKTVKNHVNRIFAKLHVTTRAQAMAVWLGVEGPRTGGDRIGS